MGNDALQEVEDKIDNQPSVGINGPYNLYYENYTSVPVTVSIPGNIKYVITITSDMSSYGFEALYSMDGNPKVLTGMVTRLNVNYTDNTVKITKSSLAGDIEVEKIRLYVFYY